MSKFYKQMVVTVALATALLLSSAIAFAQTSKGFLVGTITDPNGAVIAGATVKITNTTTGVVRETPVGSSGDYRFDAIDPGSYDLSVSASGFRTSTRNQVTVAASQTTEVAFQLEVGNTSEIVTVTSDMNPVELQTADGARVNTLEQRQITDLPTSGLNPASIVLTLPGVTDTTATLAGGFVQGSEFNVNGLRARSNNQLIDGLDNNDNSIAGQFYIPSLRDGYKEVTVLSSDYSAEFGRAGGAVVNIVSRGGGNQFHGSAYDILNNSSFNALTAGQKRDGLTSVPHYVENTFGFSFGGAIVKNKLFFFGTYQGDRARSNTVASGNVPTAAGFSTLRSLFPAGTNPNVDRYLSIVGDLRGTTNPFSVALGGGRPSVEFGTVTQASSQPVTDNQFLTRVDWTPTDRDSISVRYIADKQLFANQFPTIFAGYQVDVPSFIQNTYLGYTRNISPKIINEARFGFGRFNVIFAPPNSNFDQGPTIAFSGGGLGRGITGVGLSSSFPQGRIFNNFQLQDTITDTVGNHTLRFGFDLNKQLSKQFVPINLRGGITFFGGTDATGTFNALGNFVDLRSGGGSSVAAKVFGSSAIYPNAFYQNYFINDSWRIRENLTVNIGLRYENYGTPFNVATYPAFVGLGQPFLAQVQQKSDNNNWAPRFSFAYSPRFTSGFLHSLTGEDKTVIRGGFATNYDFFFNNILSNTAATSPNAFGVNTNAKGRGQTNFTSASLPSTGSPNPLAAVNTIPANLVNPVSYVYNFGVERQLPFGIIGDVAYVGSRGTHLFINEQLNPGIKGFDVNQGFVRADPTRGSITSRTNGGDSTYNSLQVRAERGFKNGLQFRAAYTYSKAIDDVNSEVFTTAGGTSVGSQPFDKRSDRSVATFDVPHVLAVSFLYDLKSPIKEGFAKHIFEGFTFGGIYRIQSGAVQSPYVGGIDLNGDGNFFNDRPQISNPNAPANSVAYSNLIAGNLVFDDTFVPSPTGFVDTNGKPINPSSVRYLVTEDRTNLAGRNILRGPRLNRLDLSLQRSFNLPFLPENHKFSVRADMFNAFNHPYFTPGTGDVTDSTFNDATFNGGGITAGNVSGGRIIQFQLRYQF